MYCAVFLTVVAVTLVGVNAQGGYLPPQQPRNEETVTVNTIVTITNYDTQIHTLQVTRTQDVRVTETLNTAQTYTADVTARQTVKGGSPDTVTSLVRANRQSVVLSTVHAAVGTVRDVSIESTVFTTTTLVDYSTLRITHIDNVLVQTVVPISTEVTVNEVETTTITHTITHKVTSTIHHAPTGVASGQAGGAGGFAGQAGGAGGFAGQAGGAGGFAGQAGGAGGFAGGAGRAGAGGSGSRRGYD